MPNLCTRVENRKVRITLVNISDDAALLKIGTKICEAEYITNNSPSSSNSSKANDTVEILTKDSEASNDEYEYKELSATDVNCNNSEVKDRLLLLLNKYRPTCWLPGEKQGEYLGEPLEIHLKKDVIVNKAPYRIPYAYQSKLDESIQEMLRDGTITLSKSSFNTPLIIVKRPGSDKLRPCLDLRELNRVIEPVFFPLPRISDLLNSLGQNTIISTLDLANAYHQCSLRPEDREKTAFTVGHSKYHFTRVPFGLQSAAGYFARIINEVLYDVIGTNCLAYMEQRKLNWLPQL